MATDPAVPAATARRIRDRLQRDIPDAPPIDDIRVAPIQGLYEVRMREIVIYTDADARRMIRGDVIDVATRANLTRERLETALAIPFSSLPLQDAIVWKRGSGERRIAVFADPNCPFCKKFEAELEALADVTVYTFLIPILGPESTTRARKLWCAPDRGAAWHAWMTQNREPQGEGSCDITAIDRNLAVARQHNIVATPTVVFADGRRVAGAMPLAEVQRRLASGAALAR